MSAGNLADAADAPCGAARAPDLARGWGELCGWAALGVGALAIAGVFALLLAVSRIPGIEGAVPWPLGFFHKGLVIHVTFSFVIWFLAVFAALASVARDEAAETSAAGCGAPVALVGLGAAVLALPLLFVPAFLDRGEATLNNYIPAIIDPLYYAGLALLAAAVAVPAIRVVAALATAGKGAFARPLPFALAVAAVIYVSALVCFAAAWSLQRAEPPSFSFNEQLFWGGGHVLQVLNTLLVVVAWSWLAAQAFERPVVPRSAFVAAVGVLLALALAAPAFYLLFAPFSSDQTRAFTALQYGLGPAALIVALGLAAGATRPFPWRRTEGLCLVLSMLVFAVGGGLGLFVDGADTRTPAHYHGVIAGVTLAFMGLFYTVFLPALGRPMSSSRAIRIQLHLFAWGQLAACIGLFIAGGHGAPRKVAGDAQGLQDIGAIVGMGLNGAGGLVAIVGGILFVWLVAKALLRHETLGVRAINARFCR